jgi:hypothetical protein
VKRIITVSFVFSLIVLFVSWKAQAVESDRVWVELNAGSSVQSATRAKELFVLRAGYGHYVIQNFDKYDPSKKRDTYDKIMFDYGSYSDMLKLGVLYDKEVINGVAADFYIEMVDHNADGKPDTRISVGNDSITILNCAPSNLYGWQLMGG